MKFREPIYLWGNCKLLSFGIARWLQKSPFCFPSILLPRGIESRQNPVTLSAKVSFVRFDSADWTISGYNHKLSSSLFQTLPL